VDAAAPKNPKTRLRASIHTAILPASYPYGQEKDKIDQRF
jgi:hypothetical protein